jgi:hypothetical protein
MEDVHQRLTKIAEIFERKPIDQKYSLNILCDFILEKATRLH